MPVERILARISKKTFCINGCTPSWRHNRALDERPDYIRYFPGSVTPVSPPDSMPRQHHHLGSLVNTLCMDGRVGALFTSIKA